MTVTSDGKEVLVSFLANSTVTAPTHVAFGTDGTTSNEEDTQLNTENLRVTILERVVTGKEVAITASVSTAQGNSITFKEAGIFNASTSGTLFARSTFSDISKTNSFELQITFTLRVE